MQAPEPGFGGSTVVHESVSFRTGRNNPPKGLEVVFSNGSTQMGKVKRTKTFFFAGAVVVAFVDWHENRPELLSAEK